MWGCTSCLAEGPDRLREPALEACRRAREAGRLNPSDCKCDANARLKMECVTRNFAAAAAIAGKGRENGFSRTIEEGSDSNVLSERGRERGGWSELPHPPSPPRVSGAGDNFVECLAANVRWRGKGRIGKSLDVCPRQGTKTAFERRGRNYKRTFVKLG